MVPPRARAAAPAAAKYAALEESAAVAARAAAARVAELEDALAAAAAEARTRDARSWFFASSNQRPGFDAAGRRRRSAASAASTKAGDAATTGHKGIGFKAVFAMCDRPCVLSNGFAFYFGARARRPAGPRARRWLELDGADGAPAARRRRRPLARGAHGRRPAARRRRRRRARALRAAEAERAAAPALRAAPRVPRRHVDGATQTWTATRGPGASRVAVATAGAAAAYDVFGSSGATARSRRRPERPAFYHAVLPVAPLPASFGFSLSAPFDLVASRAALRATANNAARSARGRDARSPRRSRRPTSSAAARSTIWAARTARSRPSGRRCGPTSPRGSRTSRAAAATTGPSAPPAEVFRYPEEGARSRGRRAPGARRARPRAPPRARRDGRGAALRARRPRRLGGDAGGGERGGAAARDAFWAALLDAEPELWPRIRKLRIVAADGGGPLRARADGLAAPEALASAAGPSTASAARPTTSRPSRPCSGPSSRRSPCRRAPSPSRTSTGAPSPLGACLVLSRPRLAARSDAPYIVTEILHGLAHAIDDDHGDDHGAAAQALSRRTRSSGSSGGAAPPPPPPMTLGPLPGARHAAAPRTHGGDARGRGRSGGGKGARQGARKGGAAPGASGPRGTPSPRAFLPVKGAGLAHASFYLEEASRSGTLSGAKRGDDDAEAEHDSPRAARKRSISGSGDDAA
ncbi:hypothetical protein SO694_00018257 [Aureococcus anophagefferens]|uniref:Uncharacterized protein n=1 Tax=Aureococcus anophagefferens TaxID=44056 RepID=A0ABR1G0I5_AURAN